MITELIWAGAAYAVLVLAVMHHAFRPFRAGQHRKTNYVGRHWA